MKKSSYLFIFILQTIFCTPVYSKVVLGFGIHNSDIETTHCSTEISQNIHNTPRLKTIRNGILTASLEMFAQTDAFQQMSNQKISSGNQVIKYRPIYDTGDESGCLMLMLKRWQSLENMGKNNVRYKQENLAGLHLRNTATYFVQMVNDFYTKSKEDKEEVKSAINQELKDKPEIRQYFLNKLNLNP